MSTNTNGTMWDIFEPQQFEFNRGELKWRCRCPKCGKEFRQRCKLMHHITTKHVSLRHSRARAADGRQQLFQCTFCQVKFLHQQSLEGHVATHHSESSSAAHSRAGGSSNNNTAQPNSGGTFLFMCRECDEKFDCDYSLWCHLMLHALSRPSDHHSLGGEDQEEEENGSCRKQYQCAKCTLKFTRKKDLKAHRESFHKYGGGQQQLLQTYSATPPDVSVLRQPALTEALFVSLFACDMCEEMFIGECDLRQHRLSQHHHQQQQPQPQHYQNCSQSTRLLGQAGGNHRLCLPPHHNYSDPYEKRDKPYKCSRCGARFAEKLYLKWHGNLHRRASWRRWTPRALFRRLFNASALFDRLRCGTRFDLIANRRWHLTSKREKVLRAQSERYTLDLSLVEGVGSRLRTMVHSVGSALAKWLPKVAMGSGGAEKKRAAIGSHGIDKLYRTTCPNWYV